MLLRSCPALPACLPLCYSPAPVSASVHCGAGGAAPKAGPMATGSTRGTPAAGRGICSGDSPILRWSEAGQRHVQIDVSLGPPLLHAHGQVATGGEQVATSTAGKGWRHAPEAADEGGNGVCGAVRFVLVHSVPGLQQAASRLHLSTTGLAQAAQAAPPAATGKALVSDHTRPSRLSGSSCGSSTGWSLPHRAAQAPTASEAQYPAANDGLHLR